jgi:hypothetical protein
MENKLPGVDLERVEGDASAWEDRCPDLLAKCSSSIMATSR